MRILKCTHTFLHINQSISIGDCAFTWKIYLTIIGSFCFDIWCYIKIKTIKSFKVYNGYVNVNGKVLDEIPRKSNYRVTKLWVL